MYLGQDQTHDDAGQVTVHHSLMKFISSCFQSLNPNLTLILTLIQTRKSADSNAYTSQKVGYSQIGELKNTIVEVVLCDEALALGVLSEVLINRLQAVSWVKQHLPHSPRAGASMRFRRVFQMKREVQPAGHGRVPVETHQPF